MGWKASGEERVKSYRLYQELEKRHETLASEANRLKLELQRKDELIRKMATELTVRNETRAEGSRMEIRSRQTVSPTVSSSFSSAYPEPIPPQPRLPTMPVEGDGNKTVEVTSSGQVIGVAPTVDMERRLAELASRLERLEGTITVRAELDKRILEVLESLSSEPEAVPRAADSPQRGERLIVRKKLR